MNRKGYLTLLLFLIFVSTGFGQAKDRQPVLNIIENVEPENYSLAPHFSTAEACTVRHDNGAYWAIDYWVTGNELYKSFQDPSLTCDNPYPFTVEKLYIVMSFADACELYVSADIETAEDLGTSCPIPGDIITISETYTMTVPAAGLYQIEMPLDTPVVVNEPYFAGFFIANAVEPNWGVALVTDSIATPCVNYNIWDTTLGYVDLYNNEFYNFPGRLVFFTTGTPGGGSGDEEPEPSIVLLDPVYNEEITGEKIIWAAENSGSNIIDFVKFDYKDYGPWQEIGRDYDGSCALRNGVDPAGTGDGFAIDWYYGDLTEGTYWIKATVYDTLGRLDSDSVRVDVDPTPPDPQLLNPLPQSNLCLPTTLNASSNDENLSFMKFDIKPAKSDFQIPVISLDQKYYGDTDGDPADGNHASSGEYGDFYCGPVAGAVAIKYWFDQGYTYSMTEGTRTISVDTVVERLAVNMQTRQTLGTCDNQLISGLRQYIITHGNELRLTNHFNPDYHRLRTLLEERENLIILCVSGNPGAYLVAAGFYGPIDPDDINNIYISDPINGSIYGTQIRNDATGCEIFYKGNWHHIDRAIGIIGYSHSVSRTYLGTDSDPSGGWTLDWAGSDITEDSLYFLSATAVDNSGRMEMTSSLVDYTCQMTYVKGDFNDDGLANIGDALYLLDFIYENGPPPVGGEIRGDVNCDSRVDLNDAVAIIRFVFGQGTEPCY